MRDKAKRRETASETCEVASFTECTGLMPALPEGEAEDASRAELYGIHRAKEREE